MTPQELKNSILQLAIQGRLVEQRPEEGTGEELYRKIQAEKQSFIKTGKIKKEKPLPEITEEEKPFEIPESWVWAKITDCGYFISGYTPKSDQLSSNGGIPYFKVSDMNTPGNELFLTHSSLYLKDAISSKVFMENTIVYPKNGGAVFTNKKRILNQDSVVDLNTGGFYSFSPLNLMYVFLYFSLIDFRQCWKGTALPTIDSEKLSKKWFPIPPLAEQKRIVAKIEELLPLVDRYAKAWNRLEDLNKRFPDDLKKSLLQLAIQGKLVPQLTDEGTGEELYRKIQAEKQALIKAGKIKKGKPLPEISDDEKPFDIPESWRWVRVGAIGITQTGNTPSKSHPEYIGTDIAFITPGDILHEKINYSNQALSHLGKSVARVCKKDSILQVCIGGSIGKAAITNQEVAFNQQINVIMPLLCSSKYIFEAMQSTYFILSIKEKAGGTATPIINKGLWDTMLIPLPPLAEQKRIVAKLEELLPLCEKLK